MALLFCLVCLKNHSDRSCLSLCCGRCCPGLFSHNRDDDQLLTRISRGYSNAKDYLAGAFGKTSRASTVTQFFGNPMRQDLPAGWTLEVNDHGQIIYIHESGKIAHERPESLEKQEKQEDWTDHKKEVEKKRAEKHEMANKQRSMLATKARHKTRKHIFGTIIGNKGSEKKSSNGIEMKAALGAMKSGLIGKFPNKLKSRPPKPMSALDEASKGTKTMRPPLPKGVPSGAARKKKETDEKEEYKI